MVAGAKGVEGSKKGGPERTIWAAKLEELPRGHEAVRPYQLGYGTPSVGESCGHDPSREQGYLWGDCTTTLEW